MQAALDKAYHNGAEGTDGAPGIAMLDFMKAYDTLDRDFLYLVLSKFGFGRQFVDLVRRMHSDTTAKYLVNGELSREWEVKSGIRQGCPLAPLLFIVAAEILALAVQQDPHQEGTRATRSGAEPHLISTFVDDSAVFLLEWEYLCEDLVAAEGRNIAWKDDLKRLMESLLPTLDLEWRSDGRVGVYFGRKPEQTIHQLSEETRAFWSSFQWNDNPWILDSQGEQYTVKTVPFLKECNLASFNVRREEERVLSVRLPTMTATLTSKRMTTLRKIVTSIILCSPEIEIDAGNQLNSQQEPWSRKRTKREYKWISNGMGTITAVPVSEKSHTDYYEVKLEVFGDSQMIIASQNGFSLIRQTKLQPLAVRVDQIIANFAWTSWNHTKREQNKMADLLANMAMNSKTAKILTDESRGNDQVLLSQVAALLDNDIGATPSKLRNTSLTAVLTRLRNS
ncbi:Reverse transcriptase precursor, partial [Globisporangium splendens]